MAAAPEKKRPIVIVKRYKRGGGGHHGGAWKVAYADFVTAMMAFFLVMWLVTSVNKEKRAAIFEYFHNPSMEQGKSVKAAPGQMGPGGASTSPINLGGGLEAPRTAVSIRPGIGTPVMPPTPPPPTATPDVNTAKQIAEAEEKKNLEALMQNLKEAINKSQALQPFKDQLLLDITPEGLRIQIVDAQNRPMFDRGSAELKDYTGTILQMLVPYLNSVPNHISLTGHTDITPYVGRSGRSNWDLSADRANAARRALEAGGLASDRISRIVGLSSSVLFNRGDPVSPINRRISIIVMTRHAEEEALKTDVPSTASAASGPAPTAPAAPGESPAPLPVAPAAGPPRADSPAVPAPARS